MEKNNRIFILIFLGMLTAFGPFVTDMYLPTLPSMAEYFGTSASMVQLGLSSGMAGLAIGQLIFGPISDRTGRKPPLVTALVLFLAATAGCIYAADIYTGRDLAAMLAVIGAINGIAPVTAPVIGGALAGGAGWHGIFWCLFGIGVMLLGGTAHFRETHRTKPSDSKSESRTKGASRKGRPIIGGFAALSGNRLYMCYILQFAFSQAVLFTNISSSPFIMQEHYGFSPMMFSICFGANALAIGAAAALSLKFRTMEQAFLTGSIGMAAVSVLLCAAMCLGCRKGTCRGSLSLARGFRIRCRRTCLAAYRFRRHNGLIRNAFRRRVRTFISMCHSRAAILRQTGVPAGYTGLVRVRDFSTPPYLSSPSICQMLQSPPQEAVSLKRGGALQASAQAPHR